MSFFTPPLKSQQSVINSRLNLAQVLRELPTYPSGPSEWMKVPSSDVVCLPKLNAVKRVKKHPECGSKQEAPLLCQLNTDATMYSNAVPKYEGRVLESTSSNHFINDYHRYLKHLNLFFMM